MNLDFEGFLFVSFLILGLFLIIWNIGGYLLDKLVRKILHEDESQ